MPHLRMRLSVCQVACRRLPVFSLRTDLTNLGGSENIVDVLRQRGAVDPSFQFHDVDQKDRCVYARHAL